MQENTGKVRIQLDKKRYVVSYIVDEDGLIELDKTGNYPEEVYEKAFSKVWEQNRNVSILMQIDDVFSNQNESEKVTKNQNDSEIEKDTKIDEVTKTEKEAEMKRLQERLKELELENDRLRARRGGRPAIGETRKVSLTLPSYIWRDIDIAVRVGKVKQSFLLRDLIVQAHQADFDFWKNLRLGEDS